jgi:hypothetical protein
MLSPVTGIFQCCNPSRTDDIDTAVQRLPYIRNDVTCEDFQQSDLLPSNKVGIILSNALDNRPISELMPLIPCIENRPTSMPPQTIDELLNDPNWHTELTKSMKYFLEVIWENSPFFQKYQGSLDVLPGPQTSSTSGDNCYHEVLVAFTQEMNNINLKIKKLNKNPNMPLIPLIRPHLKFGEINFSANGVCPPLNFCYFDLEGIIFKPLPFASTENFTYAQFKDCVFEGGIPEIIVNERETIL